MNFAFHPGTSPGLLLLHGTGGNEHDLLPVGRLLRHGAALLSPRGEVLENGMPRFFRRLAPGVFDTEDLIRRTHDLAAFVREQSGHQGLGPLIAVGYSNGANIAVSLLLLHPGLLAGAILFRAMVPLEPSPLPDLANTPVLLLGGRHDSMIPAEDTTRLANLLTAAGADLTLEWHEGGHNLATDEFLLARDWLARWIAMSPSR